MGITKSCKIDITVLPGHVVLYLRLAPLESCCEKLNVQRPLARKTYYDEHSTWDD